MIFLFNSEAFFSLQTAGLAIWDSDEEKTATEQLPTACL